MKGKKPQPKESRYKGEYSESDEYKGTKAAPRKVKKGRRA